MSAQHLSRHVLHGQHSTPTMPLKHREQHPGLSFSCAGAEAIATVLPVAKLIRSISLLSCCIISDVHVPFVMAVCICEVRIFTLSRFHFNNASLYCSSVVNDRREGMELSTLIIGIGAMFGRTIGLAARHGIIPARQPVQHDNN